MDNGVETVELYQNGVLKSKTVDGVPQAVTDQKNPKNPNKYERGGNNGADYQMAAKWEDVPAKVGSGKWEDVPAKVGSGKWEDVPVNPEEKKTTTIMTPTWALWAIDNAKIAQK